MNNLPEKTIKCLDHGFVSLVDVMPRMAPEGQTTADYAIVQAARVSYGDGTKTLSEDRGLIRYLLRHAHTTPFEMIEFKFCCKMPIFVARQWIRHRTANVNEYSARYSLVKDEFYFPESDNVRQQSKTNKQGGETKVEDSVADAFINELTDKSKGAYETYETYVNEGIAREQARMVLPLNSYTEWYWKIDLHNLFHFLGLRCDKHAQWEIRVFADAMLKLITPIVPLAVEAWEDYHPYRGALKLTRLEVDAIHKFVDNIKEHLPEKWFESNNISIDSDNQREKSEWEEKAKKLGFK